VFSKVCVLRSIYFWPSLEDGLREVQRVLKPGGRAVIAVRMRQANAGPLDPSRYGLTEADLDAVVSATHALRFGGVSVERRANLDRQSMAAIVAGT
jgi:hypothetical protein